MSIQFHCISCGKAIEVDATWAHRAVTCPYCETAVTAPGESTIIQPVPVAGESGPGPAVDRAPRNRLAIAAFVSAWLALFVVFGVQAYFAQIFAEKFGPDATPAEVQRQVMAALEQQEPWARHLMLATMGSLAAWAVALLLTIVALTRPGRRRLAWAALVICLLPLLLGLFGALAG